VSDHHPHRAQGAAHLPAQHGFSNTADCASAIGASPEFWLNLQATWDLWQAYRLEGRRGAA
jgi:hypothetical protein